MSDKLRGHINSSLSTYSVDDICNAIKNYSVVVKEEQYYWTYRWKLEEFLLRGLDKFLDENKPLENFLLKGNGKTEVQAKSTENQSREILARIREKSKQGRE